MVSFLLLTVTRYWYQVRVRGYPYGIFGPNKVPPLAESSACLVPGTGTRYQLPVTNPVTRHPTMGWPCT